MNNDIINMYIDLIIKPLERKFYQKSFKSKEEEKEANRMYLRALIAIEEELKFCTKKEVSHN